MLSFSSPFSCYGGLGRSALSKYVLLILLLWKLPFVLCVMSFIKSTEINVFFLIFDCLLMSFYDKFDLFLKLLILCHSSDHTADSYFCRSVAACLLLRLSVTMTANKAIEILRELRGGGAIQTVKVRCYFFFLQLLHVNLIKHEHTCWPFSTSRHKCWVCFHLFHYVIKKNHCADSKHAWDILLKFSSANVSLLLSDIEVVTRDYFERSS